MNPVKNLDGNKQAWPDHIGWRLWEASRLWQREFVAGMRAAGHSWFTDARATLMGHIARGGTLQSELIDRMGTTKQAVQQLLDGLEAEGVLLRAPDPQDRRGRIVMYTDKGRAALEDADRIKVDIEERYRRILGVHRFAALHEALGILREAPGKDPDQTSR